MPVLSSNFMVMSHMKMAMHDFQVTETGISSHARPAHARSIEPWEERNGTIGSVRGWMSHMTYEQSPSSTALITRDSPLKSSLPN